MEAFYSLRLHILLLVNIVLLERYISLEFLFVNIYIFDHLLSAESMNLLVSERLHVSRNESLANITAILFIKQLLGTGGLILFM